MYLYQETILQLGSLKSKVKILSMNRYSNYEKETDEQEKEEKGGERESERETPLSLCFKIRKLVKLPCWP